MDSVDKVAEEIVRQNTCGHEGCFNEPTWQIQTLRIQMTDAGECELAGFKDDPINRVCDFHQKDPNIHKLIANKGWLIVLRSLELENPTWFSQMGNSLRMLHFDIGWKRL